MEADANTQPEFLTVKQVAKRYQIDESTVWAWLAAGDFPKPIRPSTKCTRWELRDLRRWERNQRAEQTKPMRRRK